MASDTPTMRPLLAPAEIEAKAEEAGEAKASLPALRLLVLAILAGAFIAFGGSFMLLVRSDASLGFAASQLLGGLVFTLGLFLVLVAGASSSPATASWWRVRFPDATHGRACCATG